MTHSCVDEWLVELCEIKAGKVYPVRRVRPRNFGFNEVLNAGGTASITLPVSELQGFLPWPGETAVAIARLTGVDTSVYNPNYEFIGVVQDAPFYESQVVTLGCIDGLSWLSKAFTSDYLTFNQVGQNNIAAALINHIPSTRRPGVVAFAHAPVGQLRDRTYEPGSEILNLLTNLSNVIGGPEFRIEPTPNIYPNNERDSIVYIRDSFGDPEKPVAKFNDKNASILPTLIASDSSNFAAASVAEDDSGDDGEVTRVPLSVSNYRNSDAIMWGKSAGGADNLSPEVMLQRLQGSLTPGRLAETRLQVTIPGFVSQGTQLVVGDYVEIDTQATGLKVSTLARVLEITWNVSDNATSRRLTVDVVDTNGDGVELAYEQC